MTRLLGALLAMLWLVAPSAASAAPPATQTFDTVRHLRQARGLTGTVATRGHATPGDGGSLTYRVGADRPGQAAGALAVPLADGRWAVPVSVPTRPPRPADVAAAADAVARARTFAAAGRDLVWDPSRTTPLSGTVVHRTSTKPYALTCSSFVGMVLRGWDYPHTTYVTTSNTAVGRSVDLGAGTDLWQAHKLARWFVGHGDAWLATDRSQLRPGDVLFYATPKAETLDGGYFGNVYHTGIYLGEGRIIHSYGVDSGAGVVEGRISDADWAHVALVARPRWSAPPAAAPTAPATRSTPPDATTDSSSATAAPSTPRTPQTEPSVPTPVPSPEAVRREVEVAASPPALEEPTRPPVTATVEGTDLRRVVAAGTGAALLGAGGLLVAGVWRRRR